MPTPQTPVCISAGARSTQVDVTGDAAAAAVELGRHTQLVIESGAKLHVIGELRIDGMLTFAAPSALVWTPMARVDHGGSMFGVGSVRGSVVNAGTVFAADGGSGIALRVSVCYRQLSTGVLFSRDEVGRFVQLHAGFASLRGRLDLLIEDALSVGGFEGFAHIPLGTSPGRHVLVAIKPHFGYVAKAALKVG